MTTLFQFDTDDRLLLVAVADSHKGTSKHLWVIVEDGFTRYRITSYNVCYTKLLRRIFYDRLVKPSNITGITDGVLPFVFLEFKDGYGFV